MITSTGKRNFCAVLFLVVFSMTGYRGITGQQDVPGVVVNHSHPSTKTYLGSPSITILKDGTYVASHDLFGPGTNFRKTGRTAIFRSTDRGKTWKKLTEVTPSFWANLFTFRGVLYLFGTTGRFGNLVIRKSSDGGRTWTHPEDRRSGLLRSDQQYHTGPMPVVIHNGRVLRAIEDRNPQEGWPENFRTMIISAPVEADLLTASSWSMSNRLRYGSTWSGNGWLEGNVVVTPEGDLVNLLRNDVQSDGGRACRVRVSEFGGRVRFDSEEGFVDLPGGCKKFTIRYDGVSGRYWSLTNYIPPEYRGKKSPGRTRNTLALVSSADLRNWKVHKILLEHSDVEHVGFQYPDWQFVGQDIVALIRTAYPEPDGTKAHNAHDANYITFHRVSNFREHTGEDRAR